MSREILAEAIAAYQAGDFPKALSGLELVAKGVTAPDAGFLALLGNVHYRLGNRVEAAEAFLAAARQRTAEASQYAELAANLFFTSARHKPIVDNAEFLIEAAPASPSVAYACTKALFQARQRHRLEPFLKYLNRGDDAHVGLLVQCYRVQQRLEDLIAELKAILAADPGRDGVRMLLYFTAQDACDFALQAERDAYLAALEKQAFEAFLAFEPLHGRLFRSEDERVNILPAQQYAHLNAQKRDRAQRRAFSSAQARISVGYLSNDFHNHATMVLLGEALHHHDESRFDISLLCFTPDNAAVDQANWPDKLRKWIVPVGDLSDQATAQLIASRDIDILVDLKGHTLSARPGIVNLSDAPIKVSYLGFPGSIPELDYDYILGDRIVTPDAFKDVYPEKLCRLPDSYQCNNSTWRQTPKAASRADHGLPQEAFIFASFNQAIKITRRTVELWSQILNRTPGSLIWLMAGGDLRRANLTAEFSRHGVAPERIIFTNSVSFADHNNRIPLADLALDTFPCNGHTTTSDMLWAGLPVVTSLGTGFASRVSASLLNAVGLSELVTDSDEDFVALATALADDAPRLKALRDHLSLNRMRLPLFDTPRFTRNLERAYEMMAVRARTGLPPDHIDVPAVDA
ncbi:hypothetical protein [Rhizobium sp. L1K21]|uniref:O-linked N-acetylglucosamine transferase, SPINDLY family protein n=1 Tax=Rhizobium sp. L1K21 TaxID=2954933 RepID=UPI00209207E2|nr:hypothetical protein [Rhizobium sp. L1K21]MCO6186748.1 hypothetical protein [Rhizobium sp. L1K21]